LLFYDFLSSFTSFFFIHSSPFFPFFAHGYDGAEIRTNDGLTIQGVLIKQGDPLMMRSMGGVTQIIPATRVGSRRRMPTSLMMSAAQLGLTEQDVADVVAFLQAN
jgi:putative heme-binding domain-containing protein